MGQAKAKKNSGNITPASETEQFPLIWRCALNYPPFLDVAARLRQSNPRLIDEIIRKTFCLYHKYLHEQMVTTRLRVTTYGSTPKRRPSTHNRPLRGSELHHLR